MFKADICDLSSCKVQGSEFAQPFEMLKSSIGNVGFIKPQDDEVTQPFEVFQANIPDSGIVERQVVEVAQCFDVLQVSVGHWDAVTIHLKDATKEIIAKKFSQPLWLCHL